MIYSFIDEMGFTQIAKLDNLIRDIRKEIHNGKHEFIFDFSHVSFIDSSGISVVITPIPITSIKHTPIRACALNPKCKMYFRVLKPNFGIEIFNDLEKALNKRVF